MVSSLFNFYFALFVLHSVYTRYVYTHDYGNVWVFACNGVLMNFKSLFGLKREKEGGAGIGNSIGETVAFLKKKS